MITLGKKRKLHKATFKITMLSFLDFSNKNSKSDFNEN